MAGLKCDVLEFRFQITEVRPAVGKVENNVLQLSCEKIKNQQNIHSTY